MRGTDANTGKALSGLEHLRQSVRDILTTPIGTRVMRREYGSQLYALIDAPLNRSLAHGHLRRDRRRAATVGTAPACHEGTG